MDESQGSWHTRPLIPAQPRLSAFSPIGSGSITQACAHHSSFLLSTKSQPWKVHFSCMYPELLGFSSVPHWSSCSSQAPIVRVCGVTMVLMVPVPTPPLKHAQSSHRTAFVTTGGRRPGPGWGGASVSDVWAQRPGDLVVRGSDSKCLSPCSCHSRMQGDLAQLLIFWA